MNQSRSCYLNGCCFNFITTVDGQAFLTVISCNLQIRLFDSVHYLKSFAAGDVWVAVGWSADVIPAAKRMSNVAVIVPKSGASLWADLWVCFVFSLVSFPSNYLLPH